MHLMRSHVDVKHQVVLKLKVQGHTLRLSRDNMRDLAEALRYDTEAHGYDIRGKEWIGHRGAITYIVTDWEAECTDEHHYPLDDDWGMESWQRLLVICTCDGTPPPSPQI